MILITTSIVKRIVIAISIHGSTLYNREFLFASGLSKAISRLVVAIATQIIVSSTTTPLIVNEFIQRKIFRKPLLRVRQCRARSFSYS